MTDTKVSLQISHVINALTMMDVVNLEGLQRPVQQTAILPRFPQTNIYSF